MEQTYIMLKPDALARGLVGEILARIERKGYHFVRMQTMQLTPELLREHYAHVADKPFYPDMEAYMMSGPVLAMIVEGPNAIYGMRRLMGATKDAEPGTIRGDYAFSSTQNLIHGSDSEETAKIEIARFFGASE
ncbi:MAG: nucleoside-diphosphate kinase [Butyricicoccaceae bacterium]